MNKQNVIWILLVSFLACGLWGWAAEEKQEPEKPSETETGLQPRMLEPPTPRTRGASGDSSRPPAMDRPVPVRRTENRGRARMLAPEAAHQELIQELMEIKKLAEEEGATKTVEAIETLIKKRQDQYSQTIQEAQKRRLEMQRRIQERMKQRQMRAERQAVEQPRNQAEDQKQAGQTGKKEEEK